MSRRFRLHHALIAAAVVLPAASARAEEIVVQNDRLCDGCTAVIQAGFIAGESGAAWLTSPCDGSIVAVQILWLSQQGNAPPTVEESITIHEAGTFPFPGALLEELLGPLMTDGFLNEFRYVDENQMIPLDVPVSEGEVFVVSFTFFNSPDPANGPSLVTDFNGCQTPKNAVFAIPGGWINPCVLGMSGDFVIRAVVDCPGSPGACCMPDGTCVPDVSEDDCIAAGGTFQGGGSECPPTCPTPLGACCIPLTGGCLDLDLADCNTVSGIWQGPGTDCDSIVCFPEGACCLPDGTCLDAVSPEECEASGGVFQGDGTSCATPCPDPLGACCLAGGGCIVFTEADCAIAGGTWAGPTTTCDDADGDGEPDACACAADLDGDDMVGVTDLITLLGVWGPCDNCGDCPADLDGNCAVGVTDLIALLSAWGPC